MAGYDSIPGYQEFLNGLHSGRKVSPEILHDSIRAISIANIVSFQQIVQGEVNEVYDVLLSDGQSVVVRLCPSSESVFEREVWSIEKCAVLGLPVPEILGLSQRESEDGFIDVCIQKKIEGVLMSRSGIDPHAMARAVCQSGEYLREIHSISTSGFGYIDGEGCGMYASAAEEAVEYEALKKMLSEAAGVHDLDEQLLLDALSCVVEMIKSRDVIPLLIHNDFEPKHILLNEKKVAGIIDFGEATSGDPINDLVRFSFNDSGNILFSDFLKGYGDCDQERLLAYRVGFGLFMVAGCHSKNFSQGVMSGFEKVSADWQQIK